MIFKKILRFLDASRGHASDNLNKKKSFEYGRLYKLQNEALPFRYIYRIGDELKRVYRFKHHQLKEYVFHNFDLVERKANPKEVKIYNKIKDHINEVARKENSYHN